MQIEAVAKVPHLLDTARDEPDLLLYGPSTIFVASSGKKVLGGVRVAARVDNVAAGIITDLVVQNEDVGSSLIKHAESHLRGRGITYVNSVVLDGRGLVRYFYREGYEPKRRTVCMVWDLDKLPEPEHNPAFEIVRITKVDTIKVARFIASSYQPYWVFWKEAKNPFKAVLERLATESNQKGHAFWAAYYKRKMVGFVDANDSGTFSWGVLLARDHPGKKIGCTLLVTALSWLKEHGITRAKFTVTSGLDDYDPVVYVATLSTGAIIGNEYVVLQKELE